MSDSPTPFDDKAILLTGGTGSFGRGCVRTLLARSRPRRLIIYSRDELKQFEMAEEFPLARHGCMRYFIGGVRDAERLERVLGKRLRGAVKLGQHLEWRC
jgi:UDP-N-acetylglucosamine 4,6-dehydratase